MLVLDNKIQMSKEEELVQTAVGGKSIKTRLRCSHGWSDAFVARKFSTLISKETGRTSTIGLVSEYNDILSITSVVGGDCSMVGNGSFCYDADDSEDSETIDERSHDRGSFSEVLHDDEKSVSTSNNTDDDDAEVSPLPPLDIKHRLLEGDEERIPKTDTVVVVVNNRELIGTTTTDSGVKPEAAQKPGRKRNRQSDLLELASNADAFSLARGVTPHRRRSKSPKVRSARYSRVNAKSYLSFACGQGHECNHEVDRVIHNRARHCYNTISRVHLERQQIYGRNHMRIQASEGDREFFTRTLEMKRERITGYAFEDVAAESGPTWQHFDSGTLCQHPLCCSRLVISYGMCKRHSYCMRKNIKSIDDGSRRRMLKGTRRAARRGKGEPRKKRRRRGEILVSRKDVTTFDFEDTPMTGIDGELREDDDHCAEKTSWPTSAFKVSRGAVITCKICATNIIITHSRSY